MTLFQIFFNSDIVMPGSIDGIELARRTRQRRPTVKILLTSGYPDLKTSRAEEAPYPVGGSQEALSPQ